MIWSSQAKLDANFCQLHKHRSKILLCTHHSHRLRRDFVIFTNSFVVSCSNSFLSLHGTGTKTKVVCSIYVYSSFIYVCRYFETLSLLFFQSLWPLALSARFSLRFRLLQRPSWVPLVCTLNTYRDRSIDHGILHGIRSDGLICVVVSTANYWYWYSW